MRKVIQWPENIGEMLQINLAEFLERAKRYVHLIKCRGGLEITEFWKNNNDSFRGQQALWEHLSLLEKHRGETDIPRGFVSKSSRAPVFHVGYSAADARGVYGGGEQGDHHQRSHKHDRVWGKAKYHEVTSTHEKESSNRVSDIVQRNTRCLLRL